MSVSDELLDFLRVQFRPSAWIGSAVWALVFFIFSRIFNADSLFDSMMTCFKWISLVFILFVVVLLYQSRQDYLRFQDQTPLVRLTEFMDRWGDDDGPLDFQLEFEHRRLEEMWRDARCATLGLTGLELEAEALLNHWKARMACVEKRYLLAVRHTAIQHGLEKRAKEVRMRGVRLELARVMHKFCVPEDIGRRIADLVQASNSTTEPAWQDFIDGTSSIPPTLCMPNSGRGKWMGDDDVLRDEHSGFRHFASIGDLLKAANVDGRGFRGFR